MGRKRPRSSLLASETMRGEKRQKQAACVSLRSAEAFSSVVKTLGPPVKCRSPRLLHPPRWRKAAERAGNARSTGARRSIRWQKSVRRIARLVRRELARARGGNNRVLARRKLEAPPDAGHEQRNGETVRGIALTIKSTRWFGLGVSALRFSIRRKMFSGLCPYDPHRSCGTGSFGSQVNSQPSPHGDGGQRIGRHRGRSGVPTSDNESIRWSTRFGEGSTRSEKVQGEFASSALKRRRSRGAPERDRPKLTAANSSVDRPPSRPREWPGSQVTAPEMITTMAQLGDGPLTQRPTRRPSSRNRALRRSLTESEHQMGRPGDRLPLLLFVSWD